MRNAKPLTDEYVQDTLGKGVAVLRGRDTVEGNLMADLLGKLADRFKSGNSVPAGAGLGLEEAVRLAEFYVNME